MGDPGVDVGVEEGAEANAVVGVVADALEGMMVLLGVV